MMLGLTVGMHVDCGLQCCSIAAAVCHPDVHHLCMHLLCEQNVSVHHLRV